MGHQQRVSAQRSGIIARNRLSRSHSPPQANTPTYTPNSTWLEARQLHRRAVLRADSLLTLAQAARNSMGLAILPCYLADPDPQLVRVGSPIGDLAGDLWLLTHKELTKTARIRAFMDSMYDAVLAIRPLFEGKSGVIQARTS